MTKVTLAAQLDAAININAVFCISCGQPDEDELHDPARCPGRGGKLDTMTVADALEVYDQSCGEEPDITEYARPLHCAMVALAMERELPKVGNGTPDAALTIGEHAFKSGFKQGMAYQPKGTSVSDAIERFERAAHAAWSAYEPPEHIKELS